MATMIGGMMKTAMIAAVAYARRGVQAAIRLGEPAEQTRARARPGAGTAGPPPISSAARSTGSGATRTRPTNRTTYGATSTRKQRRDQAADLGQRVVGPGQGPREVERQDAVALVAPEQLGRLRGAEQHDQDADEAVVRLVADRRCVLDQRRPAAGLRGERREPDREDRRQDRQGAPG